VSAPKFTPVRQCECTDHRCACGGECRSEAVYHHAPNDYHVCGLDMCEACSDAALARTALGKAGGA